MELHTPKEAVRRAFLSNRRGELETNADEPWHFVLSTLQDRRNTEHYIETICGKDFTEVVNAPYDVGYHDLLIHADVDALMPPALVCQDCLRPYK